MDLQCFAYVLFSEMSNNVESGAMKHFYETFNYGSVPVFEPRKAQSGSLPLAVQQAKTSTFQHLHGKLQNDSEKLNLATTPL